MSEIPGAFTAVLAGHIHRRQVLTNPGGPNLPPVVYPGSTERTSFAERYEPKGFFEIELRQDTDGTWEIGGLAFRELPTRPMIDVEIGAGIPPDSLRDYLTDRASGLDNDAVVRLKCRDRLAAGVVAQLTAPFLRSVFPESMNIQLSVDIREQSLAANRDAEE